MRELKRGEQMADEIQPHTIQHDRPAKQEVESREETIDRALDEADQAQDVTAREELVDPTSRRGVNRTVARNALVCAAVGAVAGAVLGVVLSFLPGPAETDTAAGTVGYALVMALLIGIIVGLIATLILLEREDGRVEREVEHATGREAEPPGSPIDPRHDVEGTPER
jgi:F0F1-type ATP synthase assembly protein I